MDHDAQPEDPRSALAREIAAVRAAYGGARGRASARVEREAADTWTEHNAVEGRRLVRGIVADWLEPRPGLRVLDAGCGYGALARELAAAGADVTGVDLVEARIAEARAGTRGGNPEFRVGNLLDELAPGRFDAIVLVEVLEDYSPPARIELLRAVASAAPARVVLAFRTADSVRGTAWERWTGERPDRIRAVDLLRRVHVETDLRQRRQQTVGVRTYRAQVGDLVYDPRPG